MHRALEQADRTARGRGGPRGSLGRGSRERGLAVRITPREETSSEEEEVDTANPFGSLAAFMLGGKEPSSKGIPQELAASLEVLATEHVVKGSSRRICLNRQGARNRTGKFLAEPLATDVLSQGKLFDTAVALFEPLLGHAPTRIQVVHMTPEWTPELDEHRDRTVGMSALILFGVWSGGEFLSTGQRPFAVVRTVLLFDASQAHSVSPVTKGRRVSVTGYVAAAVDAGALWPWPSRTAPGTLRCVRVRGLERKHRNQPSVQSIV